MPANIGIDVLECPADEYRTSLSAYVVGAVDFEGDFHALVVDHVAWSSTDRDPRPAVEHGEPEVVGQHYRIVVDQERVSANVVFPKQRYRPGQGTLLDPRVGHGLNPPSGEAGCKGRSLTCVAIALAAHAPVVRQFLALPRSDGVG